MLSEWLGRLRRGPQRNVRNVGKWTHAYTDLEGVKLYGDTTTYELAAEFLKDVDEVEDWGCGGGGFRSFCKTRYVGIDGSESPYADKVVDLCGYRSDVDGILLRHVLEHNLAWRKILKNAAASFRKKLCIVLFTPFSERTKQICYHSKIDVIDISFKKEDLIGYFDHLQWDLVENLETRSQYNVEHIFYIRK